MSRQNEFHQGHIQSWLENGGDEMVGAFKHPEWAAGMCAEASESFANHLKSKGVNAEVVDMKHRSTGAPHTVVKTGDTIVDWTHRQFHKKADIPHVVGVKQFGKEFK